MDHRDWNWEEDPGYGAEQGPGGGQYSVDEIIAQFWDEYDGPAEPGTAAYGAEAEETIWDDFEAAPPEDSHALYDPEEEAPHGEDPYAYEENMTTEYDEYDEYTDEDNTDEEPVYEVPPYAELVSGATESLIPEQDVEAAWDVEAASAVAEEPPWEPVETVPRRKRQVVEDFPDSPPPGPAEPFTDNLDYSALFRMFADPVTETDAAETAEDVTKAMRDLFDKPVTAFGAKDLSESPVPDLGALGLLESPTADRTARRERRETLADYEAEAQPEEGKKPLLAADTMDFRDILREFMLGDQHPIYSDLPGIGKKSAAEESFTLPTEIAPQETETRDSAEVEETEAESPVPREDEAEDYGRDFDIDHIIEDIDRDEPRPESETPSWEAELEEAEALARKRERRAMYEVQEDFPTQAYRRGDLEMSPEEQASYEENSGRQKELDSEPDDAEGKPKHGARRPSEASEETDGKKTSFRESGLGRLLRGFGNSQPQKKKALNAPAAYASFEDYIPTEEELREAKARAESGTQEDEDGSFAASAEERTGGEISDAEEDDELLYSGDFPSFGQWILNELMSFWIRLNGIGSRESTATMEDENENLGPEMNVASASKYYGSQVTMLRMRFQLCLALLAVLAWITLGLPVSGMLKTAKVQASMCLGLQLTVMLLCLDVVTNAAVNLTRGKFGADALAVLACIISSLDALAVAVGGFTTLHVPLCLFSSLALTGVLFSSLLSARALRKSIRVPAIGKRAYCVTAEEGVRNNRDITLLKSVRPTAGFVRRSEEAPPDETLFAKAAVLELLAALVLSLLTGLVRHGMRDFLYILSALLSCSVPVTALLAFALPYFIGSQRIFSSGAAIAGWSGIHDIGSSRNLIVTDRDLFPEDTIEIDTVRIFADESAERVIAYAGTMIAASGSGLGPCFSDLMEKNGARMRQVEDFQWLAGGGLQGRIEGHRVLCGGSDLMQLMDVKIPYRLVDRTTVLLAIDGVLYGIFKINYTGLPEVRSALQELIASNRHPIFAIRDFLVTPDMLHEVFDVATDGYDFPPFGDRFRISEAQPSETSKVAAVVCREGLGPLTHLADTGRSMFVAVRMNLIVTAVAAVLGMVLVFLRLAGTGLLSPWLPFIVMLLDALAVTLISLFMRF